MMMFSNDIDLIKELDLNHPILFYMLFLLGIISVMDILTTKIALLNPMNSEGNPLMAQILPYAPLIKFGYLIMVFTVSEIMEDRKPRSGVIIMSVACLFACLIVVNNILILNGIYLF